MSTVKEQMLLVKELFTLWRRGGIWYCIRLYDEKVKQIEYASKVCGKMAELGLLDTSLFPLAEHSPPTRCIGTAIKFANHYGVEFSVGTHFGECRAVLPREKWTGPVDRNVPLEDLALFTIPQSHDEIQNFQGIDKRLEIAVCKCLIQARTAGVI
jgi:hypothetical protein